MGDHEGEPLNKGVCRREKGANERGDGILTNTKKKSTDQIEGRTSLE